MEIIAFLQDLKGNLYFHVLHAKATVILKQAVLFATVLVFCPGDKSFYFP